MLGDGVTKPRPPPPPPGQRQCGTLSPTSFRAALQRLNTLSSCECEAGTTLCCCSRDQTHPRAPQVLRVQANEPNSHFRGESSNHQSCRVTPGSSRSKTKHIGLHFLFVSEGIEDGKVIMVHIPYKNIAYIFTKPLSHDKLLRSLLLNLTDTPHFHEDDFQRLICF